MVQLAEVNFEDVPRIPQEAIDTFVVARHSTLYCEHLINGLRRQTRKNGNGQMKGLHAWHHACHDKYFEDFDMNIPASLLDSSRS